MPFLVKDLIDEHRKPITVRAEDSLQIALTRMTEHDYSQLPIVDAENRYLGMVTSDSILRALKTFDVAPKSLLVRDAKMKVPMFDEERELFDLLDELRDFYALPIVDKERRVIGVVTGYDATEYFRRRSEDMMFVEDIEGYLKDHIGAAHTSESGEADDIALQQSIKQHARGAPTQRKQFFAALQRYLEHQSNSERGGRPHLDAQLAGDIFTQTFENDTPASLDDLTLADYVALLSSKEQWPRYEGVFHPLARDRIHSMLDDVRKTRNAMAHFRADVTAEQHELLQFCRDWLKDHPAVQLKAHPSELDQDMPGSAHPGNGGSIDASDSVALEQNGDVPDEAIEPRDSRYAPLALFLKGQIRDRDRVTLSFSEIESIIKEPLSASAREHRSFWANDSIGHVQSRQWLDVDWRVSSVDMSNEVIVFTRIKEREKLYIDFFSTLLASVREHASFPIRNVSPDGQSWIHFAGIPTQGPQVATFGFSFARNQRFRIELYIDKSDKARNKRIFDYLYSKRLQIEDALLPERDDNLSNPFSISMGWERLDDRRASRVALYCPAAITDDKSDLDFVISWAAGTGLSFAALMNQLVTEAIRDEQVHGLSNGSAK